MLSAMIPCDDAKFHFKGKTYSEDEFRDLVTNMAPSEAAKYIPRVQSMPEMPFAKDWHEMAFRRAVRYAAANGYDGVSWTPGDKQAERYDLSKQVDKIAVPMVNANDRSVRIDPTGGEPFKMMVKNDGTVEGYHGASQFTGKKLDEVIGKEMAKKVMEVTEPTTFAGEGLKVGGEGMKGFYDKIIPDYARKFGKQWGAKVGESTIKVDSSPRSLNHFLEWAPQVGDTRARPELAEAWSKGEADPFVKQFMAGRIDQHVPTLDITPEMRKSVTEQGVPLFRREGEPDKGETTWRDDPEYVAASTRSKAENFERASYAVEKSNGGSPFLRLDADGYFGVNKLMGEHTVWDAAILPAKLAAQIVELAKDDAHPEIQKFAKAMGDAINENGNLILAGPRATPGDVEEEVFHAWQFTYDLQPDLVRTMFESDAMNYAEDALRAYGYDVSNPLQMVAEATAKSATSPEFFPPNVRDQILKEYDDELAKYGVKRPAGEISQRTAKQDTGIRDQASAHGLPAPGGQPRSDGAEGSSGEGSELRTKSQDGTEANPVTPSGEAGSVQAGDQSRSEVAPGPEGPDSELEPLYSKALNEKARELAGDFSSALKDHEVFGHIFTSIPERMKEWISDEVTPSDTQRANMRQTRGEMDRRVAVVMQKLQGSLREWRTRSREDSMAFWNAVENGKVDSLPAKDQALANLFKGAFDQMRGEIQQLKPEALQNYIENYFPHLWEQPSQAGKVIKGILTGKRPFAGKASFLKQRTIPTMQDGIDLGFTPKTWNPVESFMLKYAEMAQFLMGHQTLQVMKQAGTAKYVAVGDKAPDGWTQLDDRIASVYRRVSLVNEGELDDATYNKTYPGGKKSTPSVAREDIKTYPATVLSGHYYAPEGAAKVFNNFVSRGLAGRYASYDVLNWMNQNLNALQLGISAFHASTTTINAATSDVALGIQQLSEGKPFAAGASIAQGLAVLPAAIRTMVNGSRLMSEYLSPGSYAKFADEAKALADAGGRIRQNTIEIKPLDKLINAWRNGAVLEGLTSIPAAIVDATTRPIMEQYVPRMKVGAFYAMASDILDEAQRNGWKPDVTRAKMQRAWDSVDNRFGQVVYDNLFWNKGLRDVLQLSQRSVGWNFGDLRELGGGALDTVQQAARGATGERPEVTPRMAFSLALPIVTGLIGAVLTYLWTGKRPQTWKDYFYPQKADGTRVSLPGYMRDVFSVQHAPVSSVLNKLAPIWSMTAEAIQNRDFYSTEIRHKDDPFMKQLGEFTSWAARQAIPFSIASGAKLLQNEGAEPTLAGMLRASTKHLGDVALGQLGVQPAPSFIQNTPAMNAVREYNAAARPPGTRTQKQSDHLDAFESVVKMYRDRKVDRDQIERYKKEGKLDNKSVARAAMESRYSPIEVSSRGLNLEQMLNVYSLATPEEKKSLRRLVEGKISSTDDKDLRQRARDMLSESQGSRLQFDRSGTQQQAGAGLPSLSDAAAFQRNGLPMQDVRQSIVTPNANEVGAVADVDPRHPLQIRVVDPAHFGVDELRHELTHSWQNTRSEAAKANLKYPETPVGDTSTSTAQSGTQAYDYGSEEGLRKARKNGATIYNFNIEQQAQMVSDYAREYGYLLSEAQKRDLEPDELKRMTELHDTYHPFIKQLADIPGMNENFVRNKLAILLHLQKPAELAAAPEAPGLPSLDTPGLGVAPADPLLGGRSAQQRRWQRQ